MRPVAVLRPEPGNAATAARAEALGLSVIRLPLFAVRAVDWTCPDPADHDALILTSANTVRHAGPSLAKMRALPVFAVGAATAAAARDAGFAVVATGTSDAAALVVQMAASGVSRALYLGGRDRMVSAGGPIARTTTVYASDPVPLVADEVDRLQGSVALLHSVRAAQRLASIVAKRMALRVAALSDTILTAAGAGWDRAVAADAPDDAALLAVARTLAD